MAKMTVQYNVLIAEDCEDFIFLMREELCSFPFIKPYFVKTGEEALELCSNFVFDAVLIDLSLPTIDGFEVAKKLKSANYPSMLYAFSLLDSEFFLKMEQSKFFDDIVLKPLNKIELLNQIQKSGQKDFGTINSISCKQKKIASNLRTSLYEINKC